MSGARNYITSLLVLFVEVCGAGRSVLLRSTRRIINVIDEHTPEAMSLERSFAALNVHSAFTLGEARAMAMLAAAHRGLELFEYNPTDVKLSIAGYGRAGKDQVKDMVRRTLGLDANLELADDAADALAIALCHLFRAKMPRPPLTRRSWATNEVRVAGAGRVRTVIAMLSGRLRARDAGRLVVETAGVGYEVFVPLGTYYRMPSVGCRSRIGDPPDRA